jgi:polysaccharide export outer membrane protein
MVLRLVIAALAAIFAVSASAQTNYQLSPGDTLQVEVLEDTSLNRQVLVLPDGSISIPLAGAIAAGGRTTTQVQQAIANALAPNFATTPTVTVAVTNVTTPAPTGVGRASIDIFFMGEINGAGRVTIDRGTTLLQALAQAGGFTPFAATKRIQLRRTDSRTGEQKVYPVDYRAIERGESGMGGTVLADGDVILVPERRLFE